MGQRGFLTNFAIPMRPFHLKPLRAWRHALPLLVLAWACCALAGCGGGKTAELDAPALLESANPQISELSERIRSQPGNAGLYLQRALAYREFNNQAALDDLMKAWQLDSSRSDIALERAQQHWLMNDSRSSMQVLSGWLKHNQPEPEVMWALARQAILLRQYQLSLGTLNQILRQDPYNAEAYYLKGRNYRFMGDTARSVSSYQTALEMNPALERAHLELGVLLLAGGDETGVRYLRNALAFNDSSAAAHYALGKHYQDRGDLTEAVTLYEELINRHPQNGDALYNLATIWYGADSVEKALRLFHLVTQVEPARASGYFGQGLCAAHLGRSEQALSFLDQALRLDPGFEPARQLSDSLRGAPSALRPK
jgi:tetratricopeptide (TPR) repeat protein